LQYKKLWTQTSGLGLAEIPIIFYRTAAGVEPVRTWLRSLSSDDRRRIGSDLATVQVGWPVGMPLCRPLGGSLWEVRTHLVNNRMSRGVFRGRWQNWHRTWLHKENPEDADGRTRTRAQSNAGDEGMSAGKNPHWGSTLDDFLNEEGIREAAKAEAVTRLVVWRLAQEMERQGMSKAKLAELMHTSRAQVDRILKAKGNVTIETLQRAASLVGRELRLELV
jgi:antitoxin HicB